MRAAIVVVPLAALVVACAPADTAPAAGSAPPATPAAAPPSTSSSAMPSSTATVADGGRCRLADLRAELATPEGAAAGQGERTVRVVWTNTSTRSCTMTGFGGVDFERMSDEQVGSAERGKPKRFSVPRNGASPATVRLEPDGQAHSTIGYLSDRYSVDDFSAERVLATPPDETHSAVLTWSGDTVLRSRTILAPVEAAAR